MVVVDNGHGGQWTLVNWSNIGLDMPSVLGLEFKFNEKFNSTTGVDVMKEPKVMMSWKRKPSPSSTRGSSVSIVERLAAAALSRTLQPLPLLPNATHASNTAH